MSGMIIDVDAHYLEGIDALSEYMDDDDPWKERFRMDGEPHHTVGLFPPSTGDRLMYGRITREESSYPQEAMPPEEIEPTMDYLGVDVTILISHKALTFARITADDERPIKFAETYTDYMLDQVVDPEAGIYSLLPVPYQHVDASVELIERTGDHPGMVGICMITAGAEPPLGNHRYEPIYEAADQADIPVVFHTGGGGLDEYHQRGYEKFIETHSLGFLSSNASQLTSLVVQGIPEKFPDLDIVFLESGIFWVPTMMYRLDAEYMKRPSEVPVLTKRPSEYIREFYFGTQPLENPEDETFLKHVVEMMGGPERLLYASDYPHWDYDPPSVIEDLSFLSDDEKELILADNAREVFDI